MTGAESEVPTKRSWRSILAVALIGPALLLALWAVVPTTRATVPVGYPLLVGGVWAAGFVLLGVIQRMAGDTNVA